MLGVYFHSPAEGPRIRDNATLGIAEHGGFTIRRGRHRRP